MILHRTVSSRFNNNYHTMTAVFKHQNLYWLKYTKTEIKKRGGNISKHIQDKKKYYTQLLEKQIELISEMNH